jgi:hypothetical protein
MLILLRDSVPDFPTHKQVSREYNGQQCKIDEGIVELIDLLNHRDMVTASCCQGDDDLASPSFVVFLDKGDALLFADEVSYYWAQHDGKLNEMGVIVSIDFQCEEDYGNSYTVEFESRLLSGLTQWYKARQAEYLAPLKAIRAQ